jgi:hypothetical protein
MKRVVMLFVVLVLLLGGGCQKVADLKTTPIPTEAPKHANSLVPAQILKPTPTRTPPSTNTPAPTQTATLIPVQTSNIDNTEKSSGISVDNDTIVAWIDSMLEDQEGVSYRVIYDEDTDAFTIFAVFNGLAEIAYNALNGSPEDYNDWDEFRDAATQMSDSVKTMVETLGSDSHVILYILNDTNIENVLLAVFDSIVFTDVVDQ